MPKNKKKFIPKDKALVFQLVHRSQQDPLSVDKDAPQHVLKECIKTKKNKEEEQKYGIFFDDDYDYLQHLKTLPEPYTNWEQVNYKLDNKRKSKNSESTSKSAQCPKILLPSSVFQSEHEESIGVLNKAAPIYGPRPELDPDIVAAMDDDFDYDNPDNILEENFVELANQPGSDLSDEYGTEIDDFLEDLKSENGNLMETKSRFTDYSMTSSVIRRNEQLTLLDNKFEKVFENYDNVDIGCLDHEEIEGSIPLGGGTDSDKLIKLAEELKEGCEKEKKEDNYLLKKRTILAAENQKDKGEEMDVLVIEEEGNKWDCESIISTYSNAYNHPAKICEPKRPGKIEISKKTGIPKNVLDGGRLTARALTTLDEDRIFSGPKSIASHLSELSIRSKNETSDERKIRKQNIREFRRERRLEKKANALAFKDEKCRQEKVLLNMKNNQKRIKMF